MNIGDNIEVSISTKDYRPGRYDFAANATDIFGQMFHTRFTLDLQGIVPFVTRV